MNKSTGKVTAKWEGYLHAGTGIAKVVEAGKKQSIYVRAYVKEDEWAKCRNCRFLITTAFYPNPYVNQPMTEVTGLRKRSFGAAETKTGLHFG